MFRKVFTQITTDKKLSQDEKNEIARELERIAKNILERTIIMNFNEFLSRYEYFVVKIFGYEVAIHLEEFILIFMGIFIGIVIEALISGNFIRKLHDIEDFGKSKVQMVRLNKDGKTKYIIGFKTYLRLLCKFCF